MSDISERVKCHYCGAPRGEYCRTASGRPKKETHAVRWDFYKSMVRNAEIVYEKKEDEPRFGLKAGDLLLCVKYPYDAKVTVLKRLSDGYDPECNQYISEVKFIEFYEYYKETNGT